jgi:hypothetical protein
MSSTPRSEPQLSSLEQTSGSESSRCWFYKTDDRKSGPVDLEAIGRLLADGSLGSETPVWREGLAAWTPAAEIPELSEAVMTGRSATITASTPRSRRFGMMVLAAAAALVPMGLGGSWLRVSLSKARVSGLVTVDSRPVSGGSIVLAPVAEGEQKIPGKPSAANVAEDGTFALEIEPGSQGLAKRFWVRFSPPALPPMSVDEAMKAVPRYLGLIPKEGQVEIAPGRNRIDVTLVPARGK